MKIIKCVCTCKLVSWPKDSKGCLIIDLIFKLKDSCFRNLRSSKGICNSFFARKKNASRTFPSIHIPSYRLLENHKEVKFQLWDKHFDFIWKGKCLFPLNDPNFKSFIWGINHHSLLGRQRNKFWHRMETQELGNLQRFFIFKKAMIRVAFGKQQLCGCVCVCVYKCVFPF